MDLQKSPKPRRSAMNAPLRARRVRTTNDIVRPKPHTKSQAKKPDDTMPLPKHELPTHEEIELDDLLEEDSKAGHATMNETPELVKLSRKDKKQLKKQRKAAKKEARKEAKAKRHWYTPTWKKGIITAAVVLLAVAGVFGYKLFIASKRIFAKSAPLAPALTGDLTKLKGEGDGRVNIALLGIGGGSHDGGDLSDTIIVASLDVKSKEVDMLSIPRDLYVPIPGYGSNKINSANAFGQQYKTPGGGGALAKKTLENVLGVPIHYYARIDFDGFKKAIDVVGGIDITVKQALYDPEYPCDNNQWRSCGFKIKAGQYHMDGTLALKYARCRKGDCGDDYGRAARQQEVLLALRKKAMSLGTLTNPAKIASLIDIIGSHFVTDLNPSEVKKLASLGKDIDPTKTVSKVLTNQPTDGTPALVQNGMIGGASVVIPTAGVGNFTDIQAFTRTLFADSYIKNENAKVEVQNGTTSSGLGSKVAALLKGYAYNIVNVTTADDQTRTQTVIYDYSNGTKPITVRYLENRFGVKAQKVATPQTVTPTFIVSPAGTLIKATSATPTTIDVRVILGSSYSPGT